MEEAAAAMHDEFREHASAEFEYEFREQPISEAELLDAISQTAAHEGAQLMQRKHATEGLVPNRADSTSGTDDGSYNGASAGHQHDIPWMPANLIGVPTEREIHSTQDGGQVYRLLFVRR